MTTTAVQTPRATTRRRDVMSERFKVSTPRGGLPPRREDAYRVGVMRRIAAARLRYCGLDSMTDDVMLIVSELLTNALQHSGTTEITLTLEIRDRYLRVTVDDGEPGYAEPKVDDNPDAESGRGLILVQHLVEEHGGEWGASKGGAETWCTLALPAKAAA
jgi:anti-sigma regulatory factor (Ser/Thr protein kinase)